ncbi:MAG: hypothetical protein GY936_15585 [Ignavibacteriae bacterium]|nr:hypothetical protein [Ignavibacteriota bacterium]
MKKHFQNLYEFNDWANSKVISLFEQTKNNDEKTLSVLSHIISTQDAWLERLKQTPNYSMDIWETYSLQELNVLSKNSSDSWQKFIHKLSKKSMGNICLYKNFNRKKFSNSFAEIMEHVISHSTYHRGQINLLLRKNKVEPISLDYIFYLREKRL